MRKIRDILRLRHQLMMSYRDIAQALSIGYGTVVEYLERAEQAKLGWPLPEELTERDLAIALFPSQPRSGQRRFVEPDFAVVRQELARKGVTKLLLWQEYRQCHRDDGYSYAQYCHRYAQWLKTQQLSMRQVHLAGEKMFVDYCGPTIAIIDPDTGELRTAQIFVAVLGASNYTFACASWSQQQQDWIGAHVKAFDFFGGVPLIVVPDNLKSAVTKADRYAPGITFSYQQMATHYQCAIIPARPYRPKDKAKAEVAVQIVERWIMARLRHHTFFSLAALNQAIAELLEQLNQRAFKKLPGSRRSLFEQIDRPALRALPSEAYQYVETRRARVHIDYHIEYDKHYYSVPHHLVKQEVEVQASASTVSVYRDAVRVASHARSLRRGAFTTLAEHMPTAHRFVHDWSAERFLAWASEVGSACAEVVNALLERKRHPEQNYRSVLALMANAKRYGRERLNNACLRALQINSPSRSSIESILKQGLDLVVLEQPDEAQAPLDLDQHENVRGALYYH